MSATVISSLTQTIDAAKDVLSMEKVVGCFFHRNQADWRKPQDLGLRTKYEGHLESNAHSSI